MYILFHVEISQYIYIYVGLRISKCICICISTCICTGMWIYMRIYIYIYICIIYIYLSVDVITPVSICVRGGGGYLIFYEDKLMGGDDDDDDHCECGRTSGLDGTCLTIKHGDIIWYNYNGKIMVVIVFQPSNMWIYRITKVFFLTNHIMGI